MIDEQFLTPPEKSDATILRNVRLYANRLWEEGWYTRSIYIDELADRYERTLKAASES
jgi:hypothetical protein